MPPTTKTPPNSSLPDWSTFEEVSETFKDLWEEVHCFRGELDDTSRALESAETERNEAQEERERLAELLERLEERVSRLSERLDEMEQAL